MPGSRDIDTRRWVPGLCLNLSLLCQVLAVGFGKHAALSLPRYSPQLILENAWYLLSIGCLVLQAVFWPIALRRYSLTFAYFYMSLSYVAILLMSWWLFREAVSPANVAGVVLIMTGVNLMSGGEGA